MGKRKKVEFAVNLHPGAKLAIARLSMDELGVARSIASGEMTSPQQYENILLVAMRITGTGVAFRKSLDEYVYRNPKIYLNDEFLARCNGLPVIVEHPMTASLNSKEYQDRVVGAIMLPYLKGDEVWGIAKIYDDTTAEMIQNNVLSTSPAVVFKDPDVNSMTKLEDGATLLIEGKPSLLDHLAICEVGVWDKGGEPTGVDSVTANGGSTVTEEEMKAKKDAEEKMEASRDDKSRRDDNSGEILDKILKCVDSINSRLDALEKDPAKKDADPEEEEKIEKEVPLEGDEAVADKAKKDKARRDAKAKKDAEETETKAKKDGGEEAKEKMEREDRARRDAEETRKRIDELEQKMPKEISDADYAAMADAQAKADRIHSAFGDAAPRPLQGENLLAYRRRLATGLKKHSADWKSVDLAAVPGNVLDIAEGRIYADAMTVALNPVDLPEGELREIVNTDSTGRRISTFAGQPRAWMGTFTSTRRRLAGIRNKDR